MKQYTELKEKEFVFNNNINILRENNKTIYHSSTSAYTINFVDTFDKPYLFKMERGIYKAFFKPINQVGIEEKTENETRFNVKAELKETRYSPTNILRDRILYRSFMTGSDLQYTVQNDFVKEEIIINQKQDNYEYAYIMKLENLEPHLGDDGTISFLSTDDIQNGKVIFDILQPIIYDANGAVPNKTKFTLYNQLSDTYLLRLSTNIQLNDPDESVFPFVLVLEHRALNN